MSEAQEEIKEEMQREVQGKMQKERDLPEAFLKLGELLEQGQFELLLTEEKIRLVYLMNDAVESFLVFENARMTGNYMADYEGEIEAELSVPEKQGEEYVLVVHQGNSVVTIFFKDLGEEVHLYDYGEIGHFWVKEYEYLRQIEYKIAIIRDKLDYLGEKYCSPTEQKLAQLAEFPPLNYCCYPAVSEAYIVPREHPWVPSEEALEVMTELVSVVEDRKLLRWIAFYKKYRTKWIAKRIAGLLAEERHQQVVDLLMTELKVAAEEYPKRIFSETEENRNQVLNQQAEQRKKQLEADGYRVDLFREEPFVALRDSLKYKVCLMVWEKRGKKRKVRIQEFQEDGERK